MRSHGDDAETGRHGDGAIPSSCLSQCAAIPASPRLRVSVFVLPLIVAITLASAGCQGPGDFELFGYTTKTQFPAIRTIRVPIFKNRTFVKGIEFQLTEAVVKRIEQRTRWKVVCDGDADSELCGTIISVPKRVITHNPLNEIREGEIALGVELVWRDRHGSVLSNGGSALDPLAASAMTDPLAPMPQAKPVFVQRSATFIPELGESTASARKEVVDDLADQIVNMMESPW